MQGDHKEMQNDYTEMKRNYKEMHKNHKGNTMTVTGHNTAFIVTLFLFNSG